MTRTVAHQPAIDLNDSDLIIDTTAPATRESASMRARRRVLVINEKMRRDLQRAAAEAVWNEVGWGLRRAVRSVLRNPFSAASWIRPQVRRVDYCRSATYMGNSLHLHFAARPRQGRMVLVLPKIERTEKGLQLTGEIEDRMIVLPNAVGSYTLNTDTALARGLNVEVTLKFDGRSQDYQTDMLRDSWIPAKVLPRVVQ